MRVLGDPEDLWELEPAYVFRAPYRTWKGLLRGDDPLQAALSGRVRVTGDMSQLVRRSKYRFLIQAVLMGVATEFPDEPTGRGGAP